MHGLDTIDGFIDLSQKRYTWTRDVVDGKLKEIMSDIHSSCVNYGSYKDDINYVKGANIAGFVKVADAMLAQGVVQNVQLKRLCYKINKEW